MGNYNKRISIIIPIHNSEKFLTRCIDSIIGQTIKNLEIILINDASTDNSFGICKEYARHNTTIKIVDCTNSGGVSRARNMGLEIASGDYIAFIDSDDYIDNKYFENLYKAIEENNTDIEICGRVIEDENGNVLKSSDDNDEKFFSFDDNYDSFAFYAHRGVWACLFRRSIIFNKDESVVFDENIKIGEDLLFFTKALSNSARVHYAGKTPKYHYVIHGNGSYKKADEVALYTNIEVHKQIVEIMKNHGLINASNSAKKYLVFKCYDLFMDMQNSRKKEDTKFKLLRDMRSLILFVLISDLEIKFKIKWFVMSVFGSL